LGNFQDLNFWDAKERAPGREKKRPASTPLMASVSPLMERGNGGRVNGAAIMSLGKARGTRPASGVGLRARSSAVGRGARHGGRVLARCAGRSARVQGAGRWARSGVRAQRPDVGLLAARGWEGEGRREERKGRVGPARKRERGRGERRWRRRLGSHGSATTAYVGP
jgi:hypothetical protein